MTGEVQGHFFLKSLIIFGVNRWMIIKLLREKFPCFYFSITAPVLMKFWLKPHCKLFSYSQCGSQLSFITHNQWFSWFSWWISPHGRASGLWGNTKWANFISYSTFRFVVATKSNIQSLWTLTVITSTLQSIEICIIHHFHLFIFCSRFLMHLGSLICNILQ